MKLSIVLQNGLEQSWDANSPDASHQGFFFVAECDEISNLDIIKEIADLINLADSFPISPDHME